MTGPADDDLDTGWIEDDQGPRRVGTPQPLGSLIGRLVAARRWEGRLEGAAVFARWSEIVGAELARHCTPARLAGGRLVVAAESPAWATQVGYLTETIRTRVDEVVRPGLVSHVAVVVGAPPSDPPENPGSTL